MKRQYRIDDVSAARFDHLLNRLGFIYGKSENGVRYDTGHFIKTLSIAEVAITEDRKYAYLRIQLPAQMADI